MRKPYNKEPVISCYLAEEHHEEVHGQLYEQDMLNVRRISGPLQFRIMLEHFSDSVNVFVIDQALNRDLAESFWTEAEAHENAVTVVIAESDNARETIGTNDRRKTLGPDATAAEIADAVHMVRRWRGAARAEANSNNVLWMDPTTNRVRVLNREIHMTADEYQLLQVLAADPYRTFPKRELAAKFKNTDQVSNGQVRSTEKVAHQLRRTLKTAELEAVIEPVGIGFQLLPNIRKKTNGEKPVAVLS